MGKKPFSMTILGAGSWGTAIAILLARHGASVCLWTHLTEQAHMMQSMRVNQRYLPDIVFPENLEVLCDLKTAVDKSSVIVIAVPSMAFETIIKVISSHVDKNTPILWLTKGLSPSDHRLLHEVVKQYLGERPMGMLSGPSFAKEVAMDLPVAVNLATNSKNFADHLMQYFHAPNFRVYYTPDLIGVQLGGAIKNVIAIAVGISDGLDLGASARAALITRGLAEMTRLGVAMGAKKETFSGLAGVGDLVLTCTDDQSRNRRFGLMLGQGKSVEGAKAVIAQVVEGLHNVEQIRYHAQKHQVDMPICEQVFNVIKLHKPPKEAAEELLARSVKDEC